MGALVVDGRGRDGGVLEGGGEEEGERDLGSSEREGSSSLSFLREWWLSNTELTVEV